MTEKTAQPPVLVVKRVTENVSYEDATLPDLFDALRVLSESEQSELVKQLGWAPASSRLEELQKEVNCTRFILQAKPDELLRDAAERVMRLGFDEAKAARQSEIEARAELDEARAENRRYRDRLAVGPGGDDAIDALSDAVTQLREANENLELELAASKREFEEYQRYRLLVDGEQGSRRPANLTDLALTLNSLPEGDLSALISHCKSVGAALPVASVLETRDDHVKAAVASLQVRLEEAERHAAAAKDRANSGELDRISAVRSEQDEHRQVMKLAGQLDTLRAHTSIVEKEREELLQQRQERRSASPPWLADVAEALGEVKPEGGAPLAFNWSQAVHAIRCLREERDKLRAELKFEYDRFLEKEKQLRNERDRFRMQAERALQLLGKEMVESSGVPREVAAPVLDFPLAGGSQWHEDSEINEIRESDGTELRLISNDTGTPCVNIIHSRNVVVVEVANLLALLARGGLLPFAR